MQHTDDLDSPICFRRKRNWRLRLDRSIVSKSITSMFSNPDKTRFFSNSHPIPPDPTTKTRQLLICHARHVTFFTIATISNFILMPFSGVSLQRRLEDHRMLADPLKNSFKTIKRNGGKTETNQRLGVMHLWKNKYDFVCLTIDRGSHRMAV